MRKNNSVFRRAARAEERHQSALSLFQQAAAELDTVAVEHRLIADEAAEIADEHRNRAAASVRSAVTAEQAAARLRELVS